MWIKSQSNVLINLDHVESIFVRDNMIVCAGHKFLMESKNERIIGSFETHYDAELVCRLIWEAIKAGEKTFYLPEKLHQDA